MTLKEAVGKVLEGWTLPDAVRKILEEAYFAEPRRADARGSVMKLDRSEMLLKAVATQYLAIATANLHQSIRCAVAFERSSDTRVKEEQAQHAAYHQFLALQADEIAREAHIDSNEMHRFMHLFFATNVDWSQIK